MKKQFRYFMLQLRRKNGEHEQALLRVVFIASLFFYIWIVEKNTSANILGFLSGYFVYSGFLIVHLLVRPQKNAARIALSIITDISATTYAMLVTQESSVIFYAIYLWVIVGNGLRYGIPALLLSYATSLAGFVSVIYINDYWLAHPRLSEGLLITLFIVPLYILKLRNQLNHALENAREANKAKSQFLAHMSHEMRTPLNGLVGAADLLTATPLNSEQRDLVDTLKSSSGILRQLIDNVLDISRIESGKLASEKVNFDLNEMASNTVEMFLPQTNTKGLHLDVRLTPDTPFALHGDALHLVQVLINLLGNAVKFTDKGRIELRISTVRQSLSEARVRFEVIDTGIGIAHTAQQTIFERFRQADSSIARKYGGSGLGTAIARDLVRLMGGEIGVHSEPGIGSTFWFELPLQKQVADLHSVRPTSLQELRVIGCGLSLAERNTLANTLAGWRIRFEHESTAQTLFNRLRGLPAAGQRSTIVICASSHLDMSAAEFAGMAHATANGVSLMLLDSASTPDSNAEYLGMGYACVLPGLPDKALLFNALHGVIAPHPTRDVISFREHYERTVRERRGVRILVADDNGTNRKIIARLLEHGGHTVDLVENGEQALDKLEQERFDLMILDMNMPDFGGLEVVRIHRATALHGTPVPAIILTADATLAAMRECEEAAVEGYLTKPVDSIVLLDTIARLTATRRNVEAADLAAAGENAQAGPDADSAILNEQTLHQLALIGQGQNNFLPLVIRGFISETEKLLEAMQTALANREYATLKELAHMIKGSAGNIGADALHQLCGAVMASNKTELEARAPRLLDEIRACFKSTRMLLIQHLGDSNRQSL